MFDDSSMLIDTKVSHKTYGGEMPFKMPKMKLPRLADIILITAGSLLMGISLSLFLVPVRITAGGVSGIAMILYHFFELKVGIAMLIFNIPLFIFGIYFLGSRFGVRTMMGIFLSSLFTDLIAEYANIPQVTDNYLLASLFGGILLGIGLGLIFRAGGSTGGSDILGGVIAKYSNVSIGQAIMIIDVFVIAGTGMIFKEAELAMWGMIALGVSSYAIDLVIEGISYARQVNIISEKASEIAVAINNEMNRGATVIPAKGSFTAEPREIVISILMRKELPNIKRIVRDIDPDAFTYVTEVFAVMGKGFKSRGTAF